MRPVKLKMQAFGSYGTEKVIDFTKPVQNLFLITGDTGSGKSTIFDAIVFALYGEASSKNNKKDGKELQSQFVDFEKTPYVELTFTEGVGEEQEEYTVKRIPRHIRPLKRGSGEKEESEVVSLTMPDGMEYPQKETNAKLLEIIGLSKTQFMQVAMIAQGEFMELLRAKSDDKKEIFRKLFNTEIYEKIVKELAERRSKKEKEMGNIQSAYKTEVAHVLIPEDYEKADLIKTSIEEITKKDKFSIVLLEKVILEIKELEDWFEECVKKLEIRKEKASENRDQKNAEYVKAKTLMNSFKQLENAKLELEDCKTKEKEMEALKVKIDQIQKAYEIKEVYDRYQDVETNYQKTEQGLRDQNEILPDLKEKYNISYNLEEKAKEDKEKQVADYATISEQVNNSIATFQKIRDLEVQIQESNNHLNKAKNNETETEEAVKGLEQRLVEAKNCLESLKNVVTEYELWKVKNEEASQIIQEVQTLKAEEKRIHNLEEDLKTKQEVYLNLTKEYEKENDFYEEKRKKFLNEQAGYIAREQLKENEPCPVCGSLDHPHPYLLPESGEIITKEILEDLNSKVEGIRSQQTKASEQANAVNGKIEETNKHFMESFTKLKERMKKSLSDYEECNQLAEIETLLSSWLSKIKEEGNILDKNKKLFEETQVQLQELEKVKQEKEDALARLKDEANQFNLKCENLKTQQMTLKQSKKYETEEEAKAILQKAEQEKQEKEEAYAKILKELQELKQKLDRTNALIDQYTKDLPDIEETLKNRKLMYQQILTDKNLKEEEWMHFVQICRKEDLIEEKKQYDDFRVKKTNANAKFTAAKEMIGDAKQPNLEEMEASLKELEEILQEEIKRYHTCQEQYHAATMAYKNLSSNMDKRKQLLEDYSRLDNLCRLLGGNVKNGRMDLETFVQRYYLERILYAANLRFQDMSAGQFELRMYDEEKAAKGKNHGLDLMVYSTVTGKEREVRTLSGGESFMAALSLALGMADQIQESSAAINLDMMFIDEGFGSLDDNSRNQAVKVLKAMADGSKLIGIISHVSELKQEIDDQLIVTKDENGSKVKWQIS